ncbi:hypothetical protein ORJ66_21040 [Pseudoalteromonas tunicata]|uniref:hypothetical protein n=1 Tax=Pseudoalteromonas tunicata TaxID=314281 RepID=UPI00273EB873|nr:hypothetical protein [Pseudoalteromonas tunicata]MDP5215534.1 hypothetical protein [Pseudoalteromonas tunicata]
MHRRMTIKVINTGIEEVWTRSEEDLEHGKWMNGSPPVAVGMNNSVEIKSEKQTGASYGTTGSIEFISNIKPNNTLRIEWNKPYGTDATTCEATIVGDNYTAKVEDKDFQQSYASCNVVITSL